MINTKIEKVRNQNIEYLKRSGYVLYRDSIIYPDDWLVNDEYPYYSTFIKGRHVKFGIPSGIYSEKNQLVFLINGHFPGIIKHHPIIKYYLEDESFGADIALVELTLQDEKEL